MPHEKPLAMRFEAFDSIPEPVPDHERTVAPYTAADARAWAWVMNDAFGGDWQFDRDIRTEKHFDEQNTVLVHYHGKVAATASLTYPSIHGEHTGVIHHVATHDAYTHLGLGRLAVLAVLRRLRALGARCAVLTLKDDHYAAMGLYLSLGFAPLTAPGDHDMEKRWAKAQARLAVYRKQAHYPIPLWADTPPAFDPAIDQPAPSLTPYLVPGERGAVIVCPGGGYTCKAPHEGAPIAKMLNRMGISAFVLDYRVAPYTYPVPLRDAQRAIRLVRTHAREWGIKPDNVGILGFSAGGHLAAMAGLQYDAGNPLADDPVDRVSCRPDAFIPCYAVLSMLSYRHQGSVESLLGTRTPTLAQLRAVSAELLVSSDTPPCFLWSCAADATVPVENSLLLASALSRHGRPFALHVFPGGQHGIGMAAGFDQAEQWPRLCGDWLLSLGFGAVE